MDAGQRQLGDVDGDDLGVRQPTRQPEGTGAGAGPEVDDAGRRALRARGPLRQGRRGEVECGVPVAVEHLGVEVEQVGTVGLELGGVVVVGVTDTLVEVGCVVVVGVRHT